MVDLYYREMGADSENSAAAKEPLIMLHGLFGSADNLGALARILAEDYHVYAFDARNHGRSPHANSMAYKDLAADVVAMMDKLHIEKALFFGHSMGGKTSMQIALDYPERVKKLVIADIAPVKYDHHHTAILDGMEAVKTANPKNRGQAQKIFAEFEPHPDVQSFILTNWRRGEAGDNDWNWRINLPVIKSEYHHIVGANSGKPYQGNILFLKAGLSDYIQSHHREEILALFPKAQVRVIEATGHWLHAEKPDMVARAVKRFLQS